MEFLEVIEVFLLIFLISVVVGVCSAVLNGLWLHGFRCRKLENIEVVDPIFLGGEALPFVEFEILEKDESIKSA